MRSGRLSSPIASRASILPYESRVGRMMMPYFELLNALLAFLKES